METTATIHPYRVHTIVTAEALKDQGQDTMDAWLNDLAKAKCQREGGVPIGQVRLEWYHITEADEAMRRGMLIEHGVDPDTNDIRAGDWMVTATVRAMKRDAVTSDDG